MSAGGGGGGGGRSPVNPTRCKEKPWDLWVSEIGCDSPRHDDTVGQKPNSRRSGVSLLRYSSMWLHGQFPQMDNLNAVVCHMCGMIVRCSSVYRHLTIHHAEISEPALPPPSVPYVKLKTQSRSKHKKEVVHEVERHIESVRATLPTSVYYEPDLKNVPVPVTMPVVGEVQVCVDGELPVVSIQETDELPLGDNITDDIFAIMNSEGIQSAEDPQTTASWKNIIRDIDIGKLQDITFQTTEGEYSSAESIQTYSLPDELSNIQFSTPVSAPVTTILDAVALNPVSQISTSKSRSKTKSKNNFREYDPNKHCGVIIPDTNKPCTRSLTCKAHTLSLRRLVEGRIKPFDNLLSEHKAAREAAALGNAPTPAPFPVSIPPSILVNPSIDLSAFNSIATDQQVTDIYTSLLGGDDHAILPDTSEFSSILGDVPPEQFILSGDTELEEVPILSIASPVEPAPPPEPPKPSRVESDTLPPVNPSDVCWYPTPPRPLALCTFNASHAGGAVILGRKFATVRGNIKSSLSRTQGKFPSGSNNYYNFSQNSSLSKTVQLHNASKCNKPAIRRLIVCDGSSARTDFIEDYARLNGHTLAGCSKRVSLDPIECEAKKSVPSRSISNPSHMVKSRHSTNSSADMLELSYMLDPLVADENC